MEEEEARHYFPGSALQAGSGISEPAGKTVPLVGNTPARLRVAGEGRPTPGVGRGALYLGGGGSGRGLKRRGEEEEVGWRARGQTGITYSVPAAWAAASSGLGPRGEAGPGAHGAAAAGGGGSVVGAYDGLPK